jgi:hypothetical protein
MAECPNACSGHGSCGVFDMCMCYRNWMGGDCAERICPFGKAFMDSPKGDLDGSRHLSSKSTTIMVGSDMYVQGTTEEFPAMVDSRGNELSQTGHEYAECSSAGMCNRATGECECFDGFRGGACSRTACENDCSGHGTCETIAKAAADDYSTIYELWDGEIMYGCVCDPGYTGLDCSARMCPVGVDPRYYLEETRTVAVTVVTFSIYDNFCHETLRMEAYPFLRRLSDVERSNDAGVSYDQFSYKDEYVRRGILSLADVGDEYSRTSFAEKRRRRLLVVPTGTTVAYEGTYGTTGIPDGTGTGVKIATLSADPDDDATGFTLGGDDAASFTVENTNELTTAATLTYAASGGSVTVELTATNAEGDQATATSITITIIQPAPTILPIPAPTILPIPAPTILPIPAPTILPIPAPTILPIPAPTILPIPAPTILPIPAPTILPIPAPTILPTAAPSSLPTLVPTPAPTLEPTALPSLEPTSIPTLDPTVLPSLEPSTLPTLEPTALPSLEPTLEPTSLPTLEPTGLPSLLPTLEPTLEPTAVPTLEPSALPSLEPTTLPTLLPTLVPTTVPTLVPTPVPSLEPTLVPTPEPTLEPTPAPTPLPTIAFFHTDSTLSGTFAMKFFDVFGEDYVTKPINLEDYTNSHENNVDIDEVHTCVDIVNALEALPNTVIESGSVVCEEQAYGIGYAAECGIAYSLTFTGNPGYLKDIEVDYYLDGHTRATIMNHFGEAGVNVTSQVYTNQNVGTTDYWLKRCEDVTVYSKFLDDANIGVNKWGYLDVDSSVEYARLAKCLGDSDGIARNNVEVYNWDYGSVVVDKSALDSGGIRSTKGASIDQERMSGNPHIVRLVPKTPSDIYERSRLAVSYIALLTNRTCAPFLPGALCLLRACLFSSPHL